MSDLIKRGQALKCAEHDTETYYALSCLPGVDAIPVEWIWKYWDDGDKPKNYALHIRDMIEAYRSEVEYDSRRND